MICFVLDKSLGFHIDEQGEIEGLDRALHNENGYGLIFPQGRELKTLRLP